MNGIIIASPATQGIFQNVFDGTALRLQWRETPDQSAADFVLDLDFHPNRVAALSAMSTPLILINSVATPLLGLTADERFVRINAWNTFLQRPLAEIVAGPGQAEAAAAWCAAAGKKPEFLKDLPGMPSARIVATIINEAYLALGDGVSTREDIDTAMRLGTNYPLGPFEWVARIGPAVVCHLLETLATENSIYEIAPLLKQEVYGPVA